MAVSAMFDTHGQDARATICGVVILTVRISRLLTWVLIGQTVDADSKKYSTEDGHVGRFGTAFATVLAQRSADSSRPMDENDSESVAPSTQAMRTFPNREPPSHLFCLLPC